MAAEPAFPVTLYRRKAVRLMMRAMAFGMLAIAPALLALPVLTGQHGGWGSFGVALLASVAVGVSGVLVLRASRPDWLSLLLDDDGFTMRQGRRVQRRLWTEVSLVQVTRRRNGRASIPTLKVGCSTGDVFLDDVYTLRPADLARLMQARCLAQGNPWPTTAPPRPVRTALLRPVVWVLPAIAAVLAGLAAARMFGHLPPVTPP